MATGNILLAGKVLFLLILANGTPVIGKKILGDKLDIPIDGGLICSDGQPLFGKAKTIRGVVLALFVAAGLAPIVDIEFIHGALISAAAMVGDLFSSFLKRRLKIPVSGMSIGLDQIPEALLPALVAKGVLPLTSLDVVAIVFVFFLVDLLFSRIFFALKIRDRPY
jgi:CDP-diglyceride synthetase